MILAKAKTFLAAAFMVAAGIGGGCATYTTPGGPADFRALGITANQADVLTDGTIREKMDRRPLAGFPSSIAVVRLQGPSYRSYTSEGWGKGVVSVVTQRDVETKEDFDRLSKLPGIRGIAPLNRLVLSSTVKSERDLREAAATLHADMLLAYTIDTEFAVENNLPVLSVFSLGLFPDNKAKVSSTASAVLIDTRNGYVYGLAESTEKAWQLANGWNSETAVDQARLRAETRAFASLVNEIESMWTGVVTAYAPPGSIPMPEKAPAAAGTLEENK